VEEVPVEVSAAFGIITKWAPEDQPVTVVYNPDGEPDAIAGEATMSWALDSWSYVPAQSFRFIFGGVSTARATACPPQDLSDGSNTVTWADSLPPGTLASTCWSTDYSKVDGRVRVTEADVAFNRTIPWSLEEDTPDGAYDFRSTLLHEIGHVLGLDHSNAPGAVMRARLSSGQQRRALTDDDLAGIRALYGDGTPPPPGPAPQYTSHVMVAGLTRQ
jgi:hypothetical protein